MNADEPVLPVSIPDAPDHLTDEQKVKFLETARLLARMKVITSAEVDSLAVYAISWSEMIEAQAQINREGLMIACVSDPDALKANPAISVRNQSMERVRKMQAEFGMTPSSRTRVKATK